jgi:hypothetical protein
MNVGVVPEPETPRARLLATGAHGVADLLVLPDHDLGARVVDDECEFVG